MKEISALLKRFKGSGVSFKLIHESSEINELDLFPEKGWFGAFFENRAFLNDWSTAVTPLAIEELSHEVRFEWNEKMGFAGAFLVNNATDSEFYLESLTLDDVPNHGQVHFVCNSWVYPSRCYKRHRIFFANKAYLPDKTPDFLLPFRVYDYSLYNDLGDPDKDPESTRPVLGGSSKYPYPRRGRTGRPCTKSDPKTEIRLPGFKGLDIYIPRDEHLNQLKKSDITGEQLHLLSSYLSFMDAHLSQKTHETHDHRFDSLGDILKIFEGVFGMRMPVPDVIKEDLHAWRTDEEFAREMLAGVDPVSICWLEEFPPKSKLDVQVYGNQNSSITLSHIEPSLGDLKIKEALQSNRLFMLDHHDALMPYVRRINATSTRVYATRTLLFLQEDGTLKPLAIELSLPHPEGDELGATSMVYTPATNGVEGSIWQLAKAYVAVNNSGVHQLISHWLNTHYVVEPFVIATNRQLSILHPIHKLLQSHFRDTMHINAIARQFVINSGGIFEDIVFLGKYAMEMSSMIYKDWVFQDQALPGDLLKRGMAIVDSMSPHGLRLLIEDYPYAVDGLEIWFAIKTWADDYCRFYYRSDEVVQNHTEIQSWWKELREEGHGDKKHEPWWPKMHTCQDLIDTCTTIIWMASALHAAVNFGQYSYAGYIPNRPTLSLRLMPIPNTPDYDELELNPEITFMKTITGQLKGMVGMCCMEMMSRHSSDEVYLGQRECPEWTSDLKPLKAFENFSMKLYEIEQRIIERNCDQRFKNRVGPVLVPYTLMCPSSGPGLTGRGIPNSVSI